MDHHCQDLQQALRGRLEMTIASCGKKWEQFNEVIASIDPSYDRVYVSGELLGQFVYKAVAESLRPRLQLGVHSFFLWDHGKSVGTNVAPGSENPEFVSAIGQFRSVAVICESLRVSLSEIKPHLAHYGINTQFYHPLEERRVESHSLRVGWVGVSLKHKNHGLFLEIARQLANVVDCVDILVRPEDYYQSRNWVSSREAMNKFYNELDVLVVTADSEGGPLPPMEAAACGVPVITPPVGCMPEFVRHGVDGYLVDSYEVSNFISYLRLLDKNREILRQMRRSCIEKAFGPWSLEAKASAWFEFFSDL
jgi:glycosyltransferase involved in cell wall biosynthesis